MRPDHTILEDEARAYVKRVLRDYARQHNARDVALFGASRELSWNELQEVAGLPPGTLSERLQAVENHLQSALRRRARGE